MRDRRENTWLQIILPRFFQCLKLVSCIVKICAILTVYRISSLYGITFHAELPFGILLLNLMSFSWIHMHFIILMTALIIRTKELYLQGALLNMLRTHYNKKNSHIRWMRWEFSIQFFAISRSVVELVVPDFSTECSVYETSEVTNRTTRHHITYQKTWILNYTAMQNQISQR